MKKLILGVFVAMTAASAYAADASVIRFGVDASYPPFESKAPDGKIVGFDVDVGNAICAKLKVQCVWVQSDFDGLIPGLKARKFDGVLSAMTVTAQREQQISFSSKVFASATRLVAKKGANLAPTTESLKGQAVGVEQGTVQESYAKANFATKGAMVTTYQNQDQVYADLLSGRLDAALQDAVQADVGFLKTPRGAGYEFTGATIPTGYTAVGLRKEDVELKGKINQALGEIVKDGTYKEIEKKYFTFDVYGG
jgi:lysine/arginine/ornithine transport system substrate-binding protein